MFRNGGILSFYKKKKLSIKLACDHNSHNILLGHLIFQILVPLCVLFNSKFYQVFNMTNLVVSLHNFLNMLSHVMLKTSLRMLIVTSQRQNKMNVKLTFVFSLGYRAVESKQISMFSLNVIHSRLAW